MFRALGWCSGVVGGSALGFTAFALIEGETNLASRFLFTGLVGSFLGGLALAGTQHISRPAGPAAALRLALLGWIFMPVLAAPPLMLDSNSTVSGLFESFSAMTTTGAVLNAPENLPQSLILWRCYIAWIGGLASLVLAATVFAALDRRGIGLRRTSLLTVERSDLFANFGRALQRLGVIYITITVLGMGVLVLQGTASFDALCLSLSSIATAGLGPQSGPLTGILSPMAIATVAGLCLIGAWNFAVMLDISARRRFQPGTGELRAIIIVAIGVGLITFVVTQGVLQLGAIAMLDSVFAFTTAGFVSDGLYTPPATVLLVFALIGGSTISTAGGMKMPRVLVLLRRAGGEISTLSHPSAAVSTRYAGRNVKSELLTGVWVYALAYPIALGFGTLFLALTGLDFSAAWQVSAASIANAGPIAGEGYSQLSSFGLIVSNLLMIFGRMEVLAALAAIFVFIADD
jgi:trk system potassium uptake protein TrkH